MNYYIFKTDNKTGRTIHICNGSHDDELQCSAHWLCYLYGFMDGAFELLGRKAFDMVNGEHAKSFRLTTKDGKKDVEYFMLLDEEGQNLIQEICKTWEPINEEWTKQCALPSRRTFASAAGSTCTGSA